MTASQNKKNKQDTALTRLYEVIAALLGENGCPWDKEQTPQSLTEYVIEEAFELVEAIRADASEHSSEETRAEVLEELGDLAFLLVFIATLYERQGSFRFSESLACAASKMVRRHPHVFGEVKLASQEELFANWERIKHSEKSEQGRPTGVFSSLPKGLPPMSKAYRIHSKAARAGFTWKNDAHQEKALRSEWQEWEEARQSSDSKRMQEEFGDYLFSLVEYGRRHGIKAGMALDEANIKFLKRFHGMEEAVQAMGKDISQMDMETLDKLWQAQKK